MNRGMHAFACLVLGLTSISVSGAEIRPPKLPISVTVSGGASYGAYQAGFLYVANDWVRVNHHDSVGVRVVTVTGASAGAINALVAVLSLANSSFVRDTGSLFYKAWINTGFNKFLPNRASSLEALLNGTYLDPLRDTIIIPQLSDDTSKNFPTDVIIGLTATRTIATQTELTKGLSIASCEQKFVVRMTRPDTGKCGGKWMLRNYIDTASTLPAAVLHLGHEIRENAEGLKDLVRASSAFPGFFPPESLNLWQIIPNDTNKEGFHWDTAGAPFLWDEITRANEAHGKKSDKVKFVDGGLFDRAPLKFAMDLVRQGLIEDSTEFHWASLRGRQTNNPKIDSMPFVYISQDNAVFPQPKPPKKETEHSLISTLTSIGGNWVKSAQAKELSTVSEQYPNRHLHLTRGYAPCMSGHLREFLGFFERPFRVFDFYLGMYDGQKYFEAVADSLTIKHPELKIEKKLPSTEEDSSDVRFQITKKVLDLVYTTVDSCKKDQGFNPDTSYWARAMRPVNQWFYSVYDRIPYCKATSDSAKSNYRYNLAQHVILLQSSIDLLWARWVSYGRRKDCWEVSDPTSIAAWARMIKTCHPTFFAKCDRDSATRFQRLPMPDSLSKAWAHIIEYDPTFYGKGGRENAARFQRLPMPDSLSKAWAHIIEYDPTLCGKGGRDSAARFQGLTCLPESDYQQRVVEPVSKDPIGDPFGETEYDALLFLLERYEYTYEDIRGGLGRGKLSARQAALWISNNLTKVIYQYGDRAQGQKAKNLWEGLGHWFGGFGYHLLSKPLANFLSYSPSPLTLRLGFGSEGIHGGLGYLLSSLRLIPQDLFRLDMDGYGNWFEKYSSLSGGLLCNLNILKGWFPIAVGASCGAGADVDIGRWSIKAHDEFGSLIFQGAFLDVLYLRLSYPLYLHDVLTGSNNWMLDYANRNRAAWQVGLQFLFF